MTDRLTNIEFLLMLSDDVKQQGDELTIEINSRGLAHARRLLENINRLENALAEQKREFQRFSIYMPRQQQQELPRTDAMPRVIAKGPAPVPRTAAGE